MGGGGLGWNPPSRFFSGRVTPPGPRAAGRGRAGGDWADPGLNKTNVEN